jgi:type I restriction enzyme S subunit
MNSKIQAISSFLTERKERLKPEEANELNLKRIEKIDFSGQIHLVENKLTKTGMIVVKKGDLVISGINVAKGALAVYEGDEDVIATIHYSSYSFDKEKIDINFLKWFLKSPAFVDALEEQTGGGIKTEIKAKKFLSLKIPIPMLNQQKNIESNLNRFEEKYNKVSEELQTQLELINKLRSSILSDAVSGKLVPQDPNDESAEFLLEKIKAEKEKLIKEGKIKKQKPLPPISEDEIPYELPNGWIWCRLNELADVGTGATPLKSQVTYYKNGTIPWITSSSTGNSIINQAETFITEKALLETNCKIYPKETLILAMYGQGKTRGQISELNVDAAINQACASIVLYQFEKYLKQYLKLFFQKYYLEIRELAAGGAQPNLNLQKVKSTSIPLPPLEEQKRIVKKVEKLMVVCDALELEVQNSKIETEKLMQSVLKEAFI